MVRHPSRKALKEIGEQGPSEAISIKVMEEVREMEALMEEYVQVESRAEVTR